MYLAFKCNVRPNNFLLSSILFFVFQQFRMMEWISTELSMKTKTAIRTSEFPKCKATDESRMNVNCRIRRMKMAINDVIRPISSENQARMGSMAMKRRKTVRKK